MYPHCQTPFHILVVTEIWVVSFIVHLMPCDKYSTVIVLKLFDQRRTTKSPPITVA